MSQKKSAEKFVEHEVQALLELENFIASNPDPRELKRAASIRMLIEGVRRETIQKILGVSSPFISKWKINYALHGIEGLRLNHQGSRGQLKPEERAEVIQWLTNKNQLDLSELSNYIAERYQIEFQSKTSYYQLLNSAGISWKKSQKKNPKRDEELVKKKHQEICEILEEHRRAIESRKLVVYLIDECHLLVGRCLWLSLGKAQRENRNTTGESERKTNLLWRSKLFNKTVCSARICNGKF
jgi:putative transposase